MNQEFNSFVERYQVIYEKDPTSKVFAPLAEAYRRMGLLEEAIDLAERGVKHHPNFASGRVALGKCFAQKGEYNRAVEQLEAAVNLSPENLLGHQLIAECYSKLKKLPEALRAYKMVLFLNPEDKKAAVNVKSLEAQLFAETKDAWIEDDFSMEKLSEVAKVTGVAREASTGETPPPENFGKNYGFEQDLALLDARLDRGDWATARTQIEDLLKRSPKNYELTQRKDHMESLTHTTFELGDLIKPLASNASRKKIELLQSLLEKLGERRKA